MTQVESVHPERALALGRLAAAPPIDTLVGLLADQAVRAPDREFLRFADGSWTFAEIDDWTSRLAWRLSTEDGVRPGDRVAILLPNVVQWPVAWLAILKAGAVTVPVNSSYQRADLEFVLQDSGARVLFTDVEHAGLVEEVRAANGELADLRVVEASSPAELAAYPAEQPAVEVTGETLANLQYTSGTTGFPKACMLTHDYWTRLGWVCANATGLGRDDVALTSQPFSYMDPQWNTALCLTIGAPLVVLPRFSASGFMADVRKHRATFCYVLGSMPTLLFKQPPTARDRANDLRIVLCSAIPAALHAELEQRWGAPWREIFGMTESGVDLISLPESTGDVGSGRLGQPVPTKRVRVVDPEGREVAEGASGELITSGEPMMLGYWNRPAETAQILREGWLHTGDVAVREAGSYRLVGRIKDMVRRGGENIASAEVERVLERDDTVVATAVVGVPDELFGEEVKAFVQLAPGVEESRETAQLILDNARNQLARFKLPRFVEFVADFPRTPSERVSKPALKARAAEHPGTTYDLQPPRA
ncbi:acyl-CoA synthetase [Nocardia neocaledoniensis NBRC 108232]|uniref:Acyl-CoA synthetase (AMP-forming)/AMP-acid ligase II n=1 Tax=Nocardia neocaledoniensis TaxID=236511 RepID=A0A317NHW5_9NOCA|nr:AMP-binding protein [Nocardia neocaledoniensis]PWV75026.1 acyl-CoA synthetase (AMP-forming)/AMP-acid ligase II [Nocardia neocaledoniensis]GEM30520.1 acyl-CoA synthetase [Nocardia neocaledoniensis NBRC 108232]